MTPGFAHGLSAAGSGSRPPDVLRQELEKASNSRAEIEAWQTATNALLASART
jgi:hypothetical protein